MPRPKSPPRVKLYEETMPDGRLRYRVRLIDGEHMADSTYWNKREAQVYHDKLAAELLRRAGRTVGEALDAWYDEKLELGTARKTTCESEKARMRLVLAECLNSDLTAVTPERAGAIYRRLVEQPTEKTGKPRAAASHRHYLRITQSFFRWCVSKGYLYKNPFADVRPVGRPNRGKPQLRSEEVTRYIETSLQCFAETGNRLALAAAMLPVFGLRASEALSRRVRDIDRGRIWHLHIDEGVEGAEKSDRLKTESSRRRLEVPSLFIPYLEPLIEGRSPHEYLFGATRTGQRIHHQRLWSTVRSLCQKAGVPCVCPHSMRGYYASAGVRSGALPHVVAANMGHSSFAMTAQHYAQPQAIVDAHSARVLQMLDLSSSAADLGSLSAEQLVNKLPAATLARIAELVTQRAISGPAAIPERAELATGVHGAAAPKIAESEISRRKN